MTGPITVYVPVPGTGGVRALPGDAGVRAVEAPDPIGREHRDGKGDHTVADLARKARDAARHARAMVEQGRAPRTADRDEPTLMAAFGRVPDAGARGGEARAAADLVYRTVEEFGPTRLGRGFLFDIEA